MYLLGWRVHTFLKADFTKRMGSSVAISDTLPSSAIPSLGSRVTFVSFIALGLSLCVFFTEATVCEVGTAGIRTGSLWSSWQTKHLLVGIRKAMWVGCDLQGFL